ncbi:MAG: hypothetical protein M1816_000793 [Peltula sp. TS41687]|nr:MAG: hypothetical protein M1816_000793 [Peltula sp. TS41687]
MSNQTAHYLYKEIRLNLDVEDPNGTLSIRLPGSGLSSHNWRIPHRKQLSYQTPVTEDETDFVKEHLASSAFLSFRRAGKRPGSFLGRILNDGRILSIRCLDFTRHPDDEHDSTRILKFVFPHPIRPAGVSFADDEERESLDIFVLTTTNDLYTITLRPESFHLSSSNERDILAYCKTFLSASFGFRFPHRLIARSSQELFISLYDGELLRLTRSPGEDGSTWNESFYGESGWSSSLRNLLPWRGNHTIQYGDMTLEQDTLTSFAFTRRREGNKFNYLFAVSLNHRIKAWNLSTGKMEFNRDLLDQEREPQDLPRYLIDPSQSDLVTVIDHKLREDIDGCYLVTFSPIGSGQFKFWAVTEKESSGLVLQDLYPNHVFEPSPSSAEIWTMAQFKLNAGIDHQHSEMWILWKNNTNYRVESLKLDLLKVSEHWQYPWTSTATESIREKPLPVTTSARPADPTTDWIEYLFYPGQFSEATLQSALSIYNGGSTRLLFSSEKDKTLKERVCLSVASTVTLDRDPGEGMDYERFCIDTDFEWRRYFRIVADLDKQRGEAICLDYDVHSGVPWIVNADGMATIRRCNDTEYIWHNRSELGPGKNEARLSARDGILSANSPADIVRMAGLIRAATLFQDCFTDVLLQACAVTLESEILQDATHSVPVRIRSFYDRCDFSGEIGDEDYSQLAREMDRLGGFKAMNNDLFDDIIRTMSSTESQTAGELILTSFGEKTMVKGAQEIIYLNSSILFNLLVLLVFVEIEENGQEGAQLAIDTPSVYLDLLRLYREYAVLGWFAKTTRSETPITGSVDVDKMRDSEDVRASSPAQEQRISTVLQFPWVRMWKPVWVQPAQPMSVCLTKFINGILAGIGLSDPENYNDQVMWLQRTFLRRGDVELAAQFLRYQPNTAWSIYIKARFYLCTGQYPMATTYFKKAAFNLAHDEGTKLSTAEKDDLLRKSDAQYFGFGMARYYLHVVKLFEKERAYSFSLEFAKIGLQFTTMDREEEGNERLQMDLLSRTFNAALKTSHFDEAYSALMRYPDSENQRHDLTKLITVMCEEDETSRSRLITFPFLGLHAVVDDVLRSKCSSILNISTGTPYHHILYGWCLKRGDFRGAALALHDRLQRLKAAAASVSSSAAATTGAGGKSSAVAVVVGDVENTAVTQGYLALINTLACIDPDQAWVLSTSTSTSTTTATKRRVSAAEEKEKEKSGLQKKTDDRAAVGGSTADRRDGDGDRTKRGTRVVVTLDEVRKQYQEELDRLAYIANDQFSFTGPAADEMDTDDVL